MRLRADWTRSAMRGFTLVELLLAITLSAVVATLAYAGLANGFSAATSLAREVQQLGDLQRTLAIVEDDLLQVRLRAPNHGISYREPAFVAGDVPGVLLTFTRAGAMALPGQLRSNLVRVRYLLRDHALWRQQWVQVDRADEQQRPVEVLLLEQVNGATLELLARSTSAFTDDVLSLQAAGGNWQRSWNSEDAGKSLVSPLPLAVRLVLETESFGQVQRVVELP